jgi:hypothetical protein
MKIEIYKDEELIEMENILITDFGEFVDSQKERRKDMTIDFSVIKLLQGEKNILEQTFQDEKKESLA